MAWQRTIANKICCTGIGLHTGRPISLILIPAKIDNGITFERTDVPGHEITPASFRLVSHTELATTLGQGATAISTIEHLMASLFMCGLNNVHVQVNGPEVPIMDGSAQQFVAMLRKAGYKEQNKLQKMALIKEPVNVTDGDKQASLVPADHPILDYRIDFPAPIIGRQHLHLDMVDGSFIKEVAPARTFGFLKDVEYLKSRGLALGGGLDNAVVVDGDKVLNPGGLRFPDECVRHKALDAIGDLALFGMPIIGRVEFYKGGHSLHAKLLKALLDSHSYQVVEEIPPAKETENSLFCPQLSFA